ncbi:MAG: hypothetical protein AAB928_02015 [Patescibacteria group bacterium]
MDSRGIALLITMILLGTMIATSLSVAVLVTGETGITRLVDDSVLALFAADSGAEKMFYACSGKIPYPVPANFTASNLGNGAEYSVYMADALGNQTDDCNDTKVVSKGQYNTAQRSFEVSY